MISKPPPRKTPKPAPHAPDTLPTPAALARAAALPVVASSGVRVPFGALLRAEEGQRTLVVFLRHFWCPLCQDYMVALGLALRAAASAPSSRSTSMSAPPSIPMPIPPTPPCISTLTSTTPTSTPSTPVTHTTPTPAATSPCACPAESGSESVTLSYLDSLAFASPSPSPAASVSSSPSPSASPSISPAPAPAPSPSPTPAEPPQTESPRAPAPDCGTHLLLIAPGSHTLIARYLSAFDFPPSAPPPHSVSLPDTSPTSPKKFKPDFNFDLGDPCPPAPPSPLLEGEGGVLKSVRMYVDPAPATGVYAALGMGWAGGVEGEGESDSPPTATADTHDERANPASYVAHSTLAASARSSCARCGRACRCGRVGATCACSGASLYLRLRRRDPSAARMRTACRPRAGTRRPPACSLPRASSCRPRPRPCRPSLLRSLPHPFSYPVGAAVEAHIHPRDVQAVERACPPRARQGGVPPRAVRAVVRHVGAGAGCSGGRQAAAERVALRIVGLPVVRALR
ncbi:hypothetical protein B0H10DRAFT_404675 [Mycena sp. CBHHK59/15]|nr:hypothetical protein B0H10DRAFT_404675 [Mycena sp. CBHHK59/15]